MPPGEQESRAPQLVTLESIIYERRVADLRAREESDFAMFRRLLERIELELQWAVSRLRPRQARPTNGNLTAGRELDTASRLS